MQYEVMLAYIVIGLLTAADYSTAPCDCLSCQTGRPDYPCLLEDGDV